jgi:hypothetical protein
MIDYRVSEISVDAPHIAALMSVGSMDLNFVFSVVLIPTLEGTRGRTPSNLSATKTPPTPRIIILPNGAMSAS